MNLVELLDWMNRWARLDEYEKESKEWKRGYEQGVLDVYKETRRLEPDWISKRRAELSR